MSDKSYLTAIGRPILPAPTRWIIKRGFLTELNWGHILDYGCGRCHTINNKYFKADGYDPYFRPELSYLSRKYNIIICNYVLCIIRSKETKQAILKHLQSLLTEHGIAYITVRRTKPKQGWGWSSRGTWQGKVKLDLPVVHENSSFCIYQLTKNIELI